MKIINRVRFEVLGAATTMSIVAAGLTPALGQVTYQRLRPFGFVELCSTYPSGSLVEGTNGALYGVSEGGGEAEQGTLFRLNKDGTGFTILRSFHGTNCDGSSPEGGLCLAGNGSLYGVTWAGGCSNLGTLFRIDLDGGNYSVLRSFAGSGDDGAQPFGGLVQAGNGRLYGTTTKGGQHNLGTVFCLNLDGNGYRVLRSFTGTNGDGAQPSAAPVQASDGALYGTTYSGGSNNLGTVFTLHLDGSGYQVLRSFSGTQGDGAQPRASLVQGSDGAFYGTTCQGGSANQGTIFRLYPDGTGYSVIKTFTGSEDANPLAPLILATNGVLYGTTRGGVNDLNGTVFRNQPGRQRLPGAEDLPGTGARRRPARASSCSGKRRRLIWDDL